MLMKYPNAFSVLVYLIISFQVLAQTNIESSPTKVNPKAILNNEVLSKSYRNDISPVFENIVSVQFKAIEKSKKFLLNPTFSVDFSDMPFTMWGTEFNLGYAYSDYWEFYLNFVPTYITNERLISKKIKDLKLSNGKELFIDTEKAKASYGILINWLPSYGKEAWGPTSIFRSDTFFQLGLGLIQFEKSTGNKFKLALGKTFFVDDFWNIRATGGAEMVEYITSGKKDSNFVGVMEIGLVYYF